MNYAKCATCHGLNSMGFCQYTACRFPSTESGVVNASAYVPKIVTNADRIRSMTDEELAEFLWSIGQNPGGWNYINGKPIFHSGKGNGWLDWLKQEVSE